MSTREREYERFIKMTEKLKAFRDASRILCSELDEILDANPKKYFESATPVKLLQKDLDDLIRQFEKRTNTVVLEFEWKE